MKNKLKVFFQRNYFSLIPKFLFSGLLLFTQIVVFAQDRTISGIVTGINKEPIIGVTVVIKGTTIGTLTDADGKYVMTVPSQAEVILFSFVGMDPKEISIGSSNDYNVVLTESVVGLDEVVVIAYGSQNRISVTSAVTSVNSDFLVKSPNASVANVLAGRVTGLSAVQYSGRPGGEDPILYVRGVGSLTSSASTPLMLVDGVERAFSQLDPNEIESISLLKDASATAVYGVRGANGVIIVSTKRGLEGTPKISFSASSGLSVPTRVIETVDSYEYAIRHNAALLGDDPNAKLKFSEFAIEQFKNGGSPIYPNTNWVDYLAKPYTMQSQGNINITGGTKVVKYFASLGYFNQDGMFKDFNVKDAYTFGYKRYNYRANIDIDMTQSTKLALTIGGRTENRQEPGSKVGDPDVFRDLMWSVPYSGMIHEGKRILIGTTYIDASDLKDGLTAVGWGTGYGRSINQVMNLDLGISQRLDFITKGLAFRTKVSFDNNSLHSKLRQTTKATYEPLYRCDADPNATGDSTIVYRKSGADNLLGFNESFAYGRNWYLEGAFSYDRSFKSHQFTGLLLYNQSKRFYPALYTDIPTGYVGLAARVTYNYKLKYLVDMNLGYNGSENFAPGIRFGLFPAVSFGWTLSEENFMKQNVRFIDYLKLRYSYGVVGNDKLGTNRFLYLPDGWALQTDGYSFGTIIPEDKIISSELKIGNRLVTWEKALKQNLGIDMKVLKGKLGLTADLFYEYRDNILTTRNTIPNLLAVDLPAVNIGKVENKGYEVELKWRDEALNFNYYINTNISFARNKILYMDEIPPEEPYLVRTGNRVNSRFGYVFDDFWTEEDLLDITNFADHSYAAKPGDARYMDLNGDKIIDNKDQRIIGFPDYPEYTFSLSYGLEFKGFDISMLWSGVTNVSREISGTLRSAFGSVGNRGLTRWLADNSWTPETAESALAPRITFTGESNNTKTSTLWIRDASFMRLKNAEIGYSFSPSLTKRWGITKLRVYANGYDLLTFDKLKYIDPEASGQDLDYPILMVFNLGVTATF